MDIITFPQPENNLTVSEPGRLDQNPAAVFLKSLPSKRSRDTQKQALEVVAQILTGGADYLAIPWAALRYQYTQAIRARLAETYAPATANRILSALRGVLKAAWKLEQMTGEDYYRARDLDPVTGETLPAGRAAGAGELAALMHSCENDPTPAGARDAALLVCMYPGGLRRAEVAGLDLADWNPESGALTVRHGKRNKARITYLANGAGRAMADWLAIRGETPPELPEKPGETEDEKKAREKYNADRKSLFLPINKGGRLQPGRRLTTQAVYNVLAKRCELAGVKDLSPHDMRRTFVGDLLDAGADIATVAKMAGHASVQTTSRYDRRPEQAKQKAASLLHVPYRGRMV